MTVVMEEQHQIPIAVVTSETPLITNVQTALDLMATVQYEPGGARNVLNKQAVCQGVLYPEHAPGSRCAPIIANLPHKARHLL